MKPSITVDERGVLLHVVTEQGEGVAIPLDPKMLAAAAGEAFTRVQTPEGKTRVVRALGRLFLELTAPESSDGSDAEKTR
jgi:hypothetical protein